LILAFELQIFRGPEIGLARCGGLLRMSWPDRLR
jgi:hypothetical protein